MFSFETNPRIGTNPSKPFLLVETWNKSSRERLNLLELIFNETKLIELTDFEISYVKEDKDDFYRIFFSFSRGKWLKEF